MKKIILLILLAILTSGIAAGQNANRSGFFMELGIGGLVGDTPRSSISITDNVVSYKCLAGAAADFGLGGRIRIGNHWAYEIKAEAQMPLSNPIFSLVGRGLPIGFRYTSIEFLKNYSLYAHFNLGGAIVVNRGMVDYDQLWTANMNDSKLGYVDGGEGYGAAYSAGFGLNITTHLYAECVFNGQAMFRSYGKDGSGTHNYGVVGCIVGYRF